ncbi:MAG TPA: glycosyltransferase family 1 protein [Patescibacteria group bacterium]
MVSPLKIAIDGNEANVTHRVGSNVYAFEIIKHMEALTRKASNGHQIQVTVLLAEPAVKDLPKERPGWRYQILTPKKFWTQWALPIHLFLHRNNYHVFFTPGHYAPRLSVVPYISSVMDVAFLEFPEQFKKNDLLQLTHWTKYSVTNAQKVIAISEATKQDIVAKYGKAASDIVVAYPSVTLPSKEATSLKKAATLKKLGIQKPYVVYVGTLQPRKNIIKMVEAFESLKRSLASQDIRQKSKLKRQHHSEKLQLVVAGKIGWLADDTLQRIKESPFFSDILLPGYVTEDVKQILLQEAEASILVGLYEGFGIPPLESMHLGTLPIVAHAMSLPEVVGKAGILVDPLSHHSIADGIKKALQLTAKGKAKYRREMRKQVKKFSWEESAQKILGALIEVGENKQ